MHRTVRRFVTAALAIGCGVGDKMTRLRLSPVIVAILLATACLALLTTTAAARADTITIVPPASMITTNDPTDEQGRTDQRNVTFLIEGSWSNLECSFDDPDDDDENTMTSCGTPVTPCPVAQCLAFSRTGLLNGPEDLSVASDGDAVGDGAADADYSFYVDLTPPRTDVELGNKSPTRPDFEPNYNEDDENISDTFQCSFTRGALSAPQWFPCPDPDFRPPALPARHIDYVFRARAVDDFGRSANTATIPYDPMPCTLGRLRSMRPLAFEVYGIRYSLRCAASASDVELDLYLLGENGHRHSLAWVVRHHTQFGFSYFRHHLTRRGRQLLEPDDSLDIELKRDRSARLALVARPTIDASVSGLPVARIFSLHH